MNDVDLAFAPVTTLSRLLARKEVSSAELTRLFLDRLEKLGPRLNAVAELTPDTALEQAAKADALIAAGEPPSPLTGIPYGAKDLLATAGIPTRWGSPAHRDQVFDADATVIRKLREAGAVLVAKLAMVELAGGGGYNTPRASLHGPGRNPWDRKRWAGGSSSGSGAAVSAGLVPFALGSETWGSIVTPAAFCGVTGLRPTHGLVSLHGAMPLSWQMDKVGPLARTARDCGLVLDAIAGPDRLDPTTSAVALPGRVRPVRTLGVVEPPAGAASPVTSEFEAALDVLRQTGHRTVPVEIPALPYGETADTILNADIAAAHGDFITDRSRLRLLRDPSQRRGLRGALRITGQAYARALKERETIRLEIDRLFERVDALVGPSLAIEAPPISSTLQESFEAAGGVSVLGALCGVPENTVPMGSGPAGLPLGLSFVGPRFSDRALIRVARTFQRHTAWHARRPPGFS